MIYFDTSFITPYYIYEKTSMDVLATVQAIPTGQLALSQWTVTEFASLLSRRVRMDELTASVAQSTMLTFETHVQTAFKLLSISPSEHVLARRWMLNDPHNGLRAADALHLAISHVQGYELYTLDKLLLKAAHTLRVNASSGGISL